MQAQLESCQQLLAGFDCLLLSTVTNEGDPLASFAPFVRFHNSFYIFVSELAQHTKNMRDSPRASVMFIQSEQSARNLYARERAVIQVDVKEVSDIEVKDSVFALMLESHGKTVNLLRTLSDFKMLELKPSKARYVVGFGKAYDWDIELNEMRHVSAQVLQVESEKDSPDDVQIKE
jgi:putative heme iron utilization protein